jgi:2-polyprenyl-3-methyl-5-hydroxy-6-metoxy-1,4-benzoquinol methylase
VSAVAEARRFGFGQNWLSFLDTVDAERVRQAEKSLEQKLGAGALEGRSFLDIGSGSGLFSLAAARLGAARVQSFDYDAQSVACTAEIKRRWYDGDVAWTIEQGSVLDEQYLRGLGQWDVVYSWGVLHHTGRMWDALGNAAGLVAPGGTLFIAIYNEQGRVSRFWCRVKRTYNRHPLGRALVVGTFIPYWVVRGAAVDLLRMRNPARRYREYRHERGMSMLHDWIDWLGGYPYEVARPAEVSRFFQERCFVPQDLVTSGGLGCNEYVFRRPS